jgi:predicted CXXCH cytochrome family protein
LDNQFQVFKKHFLSQVILFGSLVFFCMVGCDRVTRYKILSFFFEGVPTPDDKRPGVGDDVNIVIITNVEKLDVMNPENRTIEPDKYGQKLSSSHEFARDCAQCHTGGFSSGQQELREPLPDLCYSCHRDLIQEGDYLHGPLNVGECIFCHDPHQSAYIHLQKAPEPLLCYRCHQQPDIAVIPGHQACLDKVCTDCHDPHGSSMPHLFKTGVEELNNPDSVD